MTRMRVRGTAFYCRTRKLEHLKIVDLKTVYDEQFLNIVNSKYCFASFGKVTINPRLYDEMEYYEFESISPGI